jgi:hypothetical protein
MVDSFLSLPFIFSLSFQSGDAMYVFFQSGDGRFETGKRVESDFYLFCNLHQSLQNPHLVTLNKLFPLRKFARIVDIILSVISFGNN